MTPEQKQWLTDNPTHEVWRPLPVVTLYQWTDDAWLLEDGRQLPERPKFAPFMGGSFSSGDTLYSAQPLLHVVRRVQMT
jgi:hypothetical protein